MYEFYTEPCQVGQIYDATIRRIYSETAVEDIKFGAPLALDTSGNAVNINPDGTSSATGLMGIAVFDQRRTDGLYHDKDRISVMNIGRIWVEVNNPTDVRAGVIAYVGADQQFRIDDNSGDNPLKAGVFIDTATLLQDGTYVAPLELNLEI